MIDIQALTSLGPIPLLIAACNAIGLALKKSPLSDRWIPLILTIVGAASYPFITSEADANVRNPVVFNVIVGALIGGSAVGVNQMFRQLIGGQKEQPDKQNEKQTDTAGPAAGA